MHTNKPPDMHVLGRRACYIYKAVCVKVCMKVRELQRLLHHVYTHTLSREQARFCRCKLSASLCPH